jgi:hypothetical protein
MSVVPSQILYLEHGSSRLYAEAVQVIETRRLCWARPTLLIQGLPEDLPEKLPEKLLPGDRNSFKARQSRQDVISAAAFSLENSTLDLYDLENCPDLIWPLAFFEIAYDIDFFSLIVQLKINPNPIAQQNGSHQLNAFIHSFWHSHADVFQPAVS